jgi:hypothetical protein
MNEIKIPSIEFVRLKKGMTDSELYDYMAENDDWGCFLVYLRYKYDFEEEWDYFVECASYDCCTETVFWLNDWYEGQQNVEYLAISKLGWLESEKKQETNFEHFKEDIVNLFIDNLSVVDGKPNRCICTVCDERCDIRANCDDETHYELVKAWLRNPYKKPTYKLTKFEKELLQCYSSAYRFKLFNSLNGMKEKGYFKSVDENEKIEDILANCEVVKNAES